MDKFNEEYLKIINEGIVDSILKGAGTGAGLGGVATYFGSGGNPIAALGGSIIGGGVGALAGGLLNVVERIENFLTSKKNVDNDLKYKKLKEIENKINNKTYNLQDEEDLVNIIKELKEEKEEI